MLVLTIVLWFFARTFDILKAMEGEKFEPSVFNTHSVKLRAHFETYGGDQKFENGEGELDDIRTEIAEHFGVPNDENHILIIDNDMVENQRHRRAFSVIVRKKPGEEDAWYIDGRTAHITQLNRLYNYYGVPDDEFNEKHMGFLDVDGFDDIEDIQKESQKKGKPIHWFIRVTAPLGTI